MPDLEIFHQNNYAQKEREKNGVRYLEILDEPLLQDLLADQSILADKGFQATAESFRAVYLKKYYQNYPLDRQSRH